MGNRLLKFLSFRANSVAVSAALIGIASMLSRFFGVYRDRLLSGTFGAGHELDAYYAAFRFPDFFFNLFVLGAIGAGFIPVMSSYLAQDRGQEGPAAPSWHFVQRLATVIGVIITATSIFCGLFAPVLVPLVTPGFTPENIRLTVTLTRIMFLGGPILALSSVMGSVLQSHRRFLAYSLAPIAYNVGIIIGTLFLGRRYGVVGAAWGVVLGIILHFFIQFIAARSLGFRFRWRWQPRDAGVREVIRLAVPRTLSLAMSQVNLIILTSVATTIGIGALAVFNLANNLQSFPVSLIGISFAVASFPVVAALAAEGRHAELVKEFSRLTRTVLYLAVPATVVFLLLRAQIVRVVLGTGRFSWNDTVMTSDAMAYFIISLFAQALIPIIARTFFALHDVKTPLVTGVIAIVVERVLAYWLVRWGLGTPGLALAFSVGSVVNLALFWWLLRRRLGPLDERRIITALGFMSVAGLAAVAVVQASKIIIGGVVDMHSFLGVFTQGAIAGTLGLGAYFLVTLAFGMSEAKVAVGLVRRRLAPAVHRLRGRAKELECTVEVTTMAGQVDAQCAPDSSDNPPQL